MRLLFLAALFLPMTAMADTSAANHAEVKNDADYSTAASSETERTPAATTAVKNTTITGLAPSPTPVPAPAAPPSPWRVSYFSEYQGPTFDNLDFSKTQYPNQKPGDSEIDHSFKVGYAVSKNVTIGTQFRASNFFGASYGFGWSDQRFYSQWSHMIETSDVDMSGKVVFEVPTTTSSRNAGKILAVKLDFNFELKTQLRNWSFTAMFELKPYFYNDPATSNATDLEFGIYPYITLDLSPNVQLLFEGSFDGNHKYQSANYDFTSAYNDYLDIGPIFTINSHINTNIAMRFFTDNLSPADAAIYANIGIAL